MTARPPLDGVRVLDLSRVLAGPLCTMVLADLGADVIKVERPEGGDETRAWGPPFEGGEASYFLALNRGKRSAALDLGDPSDRDVVLGLVASCDVVVENFKAGGLERLGLGLDALRARRPDLIVCSVTGFGSARAPADRPGYDFLAQAESGLMSITGYDAPTKVGVAIVDVVAGLHLATAVLAALRRRDRDGAGAHVEVSLLDAGLASLVNVGANALAGEEPRRWGNAHPNIVPYQSFATAEGEVAVAVGNDAAFARLCSVLGVRDDERFATNAGRVEHRDEVVGLLAGALLADTADGWVERLHAVGVPAGKVRGVGEALDAAAAAGDPAVATLEHPTAGTIRTLRPPARLDGEALMADRPPPLLGEHTAEVRAQARSTLARMPTQLVHTCVRVRDVGASLRFYEALGFERRGRLNFASAYNVYLGLPGGGDVLELTVNAGREEPYDLGDGFNHVALTVDDLDATLATLAGLGVQPEKPPFRPGDREDLPRIAFVADPDGYRVELIDGGAFATPQDPDPA